MDGFSFEFSYRVGVADINYGGHVANSAVLNFFQDARISYLANLGPYSEMDLGGCGLIMAAAHVFFRQEMFLGDELQIGVRSCDLKRSGWVMEYRIERATELTAEGETPVLCFNYNTGKLCRIPAEFRSALTDFEKL